MLRSYTPFKHAILAYVLHTRLKNKLGSPVLRLYGFSLEVVALATGA